MGAVYRVEHVHMRKDFALKVLYGEALRQPEIVARFEREAVAAATIVHPNVVAATDFGKLPDGSFFLVLELVDGRSLRRDLEAGALDPARATKIMRGIVHAVAAAHGHGIVHRDLKPENIMLVRRDGDDDFVKVLDFGIAKLSGPDATSRESGVQPLTRLGAIMGTPDYMSPEQALGQPADARSDLYAVGVIFFEMLTGACPFRGSTATVLRQHIAEAPPSVPADVVARLGPRVSDVIARLLAKEPRARFQTAVELLVALDEGTGTANAASAPAQSVGAPPADARTAPAISAFRSIAKETAERAKRSLPMPLRPCATERRLAWIGVVLVAGVVFPVAFGAFSKSKPAVVPIPIASESPLASQSPPPAPLRTASPHPARPPSSLDGRGDWPAAASSERAAGATATSTEAPASSSRAPTSPPSRGRKTGPGGIYIPPPKTWFK